MTDKQIIIDGCIHLDEWKHCNICEKLIKTKDGANGKKREHLLTEEDLRCDFYPNCYYKQLARKEQECEELKKDIKDIANLLDLDTGEEYNFGNIEMEIKELKAENDSLFKAIEEIENIIGKYKLSETVIKLNRIDPIDVQEILNIVIKVRNNKCEELKKDLTDLSKIIDCKNGTILTFKEQLDKLKEENKHLSEKEEEAKHYLEEAEKFKNCLTEIKDITEKQCNICEALTPIDEYKDCKKCWQGKILQKISECEVKYEN